MAKSINTENRIIDILKGGKLSRNSLVKEYKKRYNLSEGSCAYQLRKLLEIGSIIKTPIKGAGERPVMVYYSLKRQ